MNEYRYAISLIYMYNNKEFIIKTEHIHNMVIDYDYDDKNMPIIFLTLSLDKNIIDDMIKNSTKKTITLTVSKFQKDAKFSIKENYIHDQFIYFLSNELNDVSDLDYSQQTKESTDIYRKISIGLMNINLINNNKRMINDVIVNTSLINIIAKHTSHMKFLIEPMNNTMVNRLIIPPLNSVTNFISYVNEYHNLYKTPYRLFYGFDKSYLLSSSGNPLEAKGEESSTVIFNINNTTNPQSKLDGMVIDKKQKAYIIELSHEDISYYQDKATDISYNTIVGIDSNGRYKEVNLNLENTNRKSKKVKIERITNGNLDKLNQIKKEIENSSVYINIVKAELDTSVLTINKKYIVKNYNKLTDKNGNFLLSRKKEVYSPDDGNFVLTSILTLRKVIS